MAQSFIGQTSSSHNFRYTSTERALTHCIVDPCGKLTPDHPHPATGLFQRLAQRRQRPVKHGQQVALQPFYEPALL